MLRSLALLIAVSSSSAAAAAPETIPLPPFRSVELRGGGSVVLRHGPIQRITLLEGSSAHTGVRVLDDGALRIDACRTHCPRRYNLRIEIVSPTVPNLAVSRGGRISAAPGFPAQPALGTAVYRGGQVDMRAVAVRRVSAALSSGGQILVWAEQSLDVALTRGGHVGYRGSPAVRSAVGGGGNITPIP